MQIYGESLASIDHGEWFCTFASEDTTSAGLSTCLRGYRSSDMALKYTCGCWGSSIGWSVGLGLGHPWRWAHFLGVGDPNILGNGICRWTWWCPRIKLHFTGGLGIRPWQSLLLADKESHIRHVSLHRSPGSYQLPNNTPALWPVVCVCVPGMLIYTKFIGIFILIYNIFHYIIKLD